MKKGLFLAMLLCLTMSIQANAEVPGLMNYQGYLTDLDGLPLNGVYEMYFVLYGSETGDDELYRDPPIEYIPVTVQGGSFSVVLGGFDPANPMPSELFLEPEIYLQVFIYNETEYEEIWPRFQITSVGYAFNAFLKK